MNITTPRLILRPFEVRDIPSFCVYRSHPGVALYQSWTPPYTLEMGENFVAEMRALEPGQRGHWYQLALERREDGVHLGDCAVMITTSLPPQAEIGFTLAPSHQGRGYMGEAVGALVQHLFTVVGVDQVFALTDARNRPSIQVLERLGMVRTETFTEVEFKGEKVTEYLYTLSRSGWEQGQKPPHR